MGCDIHAYVEIRKNGQWEHYDWREEFHRCEYEDGSHDYDYRKMWDHPLYVGRNYDLFAMLANVRNGYGFAGCNTGEGFVPICEPKGLPEDVTPEVRKESDDWGCDGHSHSWHTLKALQDYYWSRTTVHRGWVDASGFKHFQENGKPNQWCGGVAGGSTQHITPQEMQRRLIAHENTEHCYCQVEWTEPYSHSAARFLTHTMPHLAKLGAPEDVRLVFWFDN